MDVDAGASQKNWICRSIVDFLISSTECPYSIHFLINSTSLAMRSLIPLYVITMFAAITSAQYDLDFNLDEPIVLSLLPDADNAVKWNPDEEIVVPKIQAADDDKTACDNGSGDHRLTRACCWGTGEGELRPGVYLRVYKCRRCKLLSLIIDPIPSHLHRHYNFARNRRP